MTPITIKQLSQTLEDGWGNYISKFRRLSLDEQALFLEKQGFHNFHDLLAHIIGWWEEGLRVINGILETPGFIWEARDVDVFNRELVEKYHSWNEDDLLLHFENVRLALINLVAELPEKALENEDINDWLAADVIGHLEDHRID